MIGVAAIAFAAIAFAWGLAEATLFFLVPDVYLSRVALRGVRPALAACGLALAGALAGGPVMYWWASVDAPAAERTLDALPAISPGMIERVRDELGRGAWRAMITGSFRGTPYKVYAVESGRLGLDLGGFLLATPAARLPRFVLVTLLAAGISKLLPQAWTLKRKQAIHAAAWTAFYAVYWAVMPW